MRIYIEETDLLLSLSYISYHYYPNQVIKNVMKKQNHKKENYGIVGQRTTIIIRSSNNK